MTTPTPSPYNTQIPDSDTSIADAQTLFQNNFLRLFEAFNTDHVSLDDATNPGNHNVVQLVELPVGENTQSQEIAIYSKKVDGQTDQLFMRYPNNGSEFQITEYQIYSIVSTNLQESYFTFLPGKIIVYFGRVFSNNTNVFDITVNPPVTKILAGINVCGVTTSLISQPQPNISLIAYSDGFFRTIRLTTNPTKMFDNFYLFFGNL